MQAKLKEMVSVIRPSIGGQIPTSELENILSELGFEYLTIKSEEITAQLDPQGSGLFNQDEFVDYLMNHQVEKYTDMKALKQAIKAFDYDNDGKVQYEEFEYFMKNFGETESFYMDEAKIQAMLECTKPLDKNGLIDIDVLVNNLTAWYQLLNSKEEDEE